MTLLRWGADPGFGRGSVRGSGWWKSPVGSRNKVPIESLAEIPQKAGDHLLIALRVQGCTPKKAYIVFCQLSITDGGLIEWWEERGLIRPNSTNPSLVSVLAPERNSTRTWWRTRSCGRMATCCGCTRPYSPPTARSTSSTSRSTRRTAISSSSPGRSADSKSTSLTVKISRTPSTTTPRTRWRSGADLLVLVLRQFLSVLRHWWLHGGKAGMLILGLGLGLGLKAKFLALALALIFSGVGLELLALALVLNALVLE